MEKPQDHDVVALFEGSARYCESMFGSGSPGMTFSMRCPNATGILFHRWLRAGCTMPILLSLAAVLAVAGCASHPSIGTAGITYVVVRHAEKATDDPRDPALSEAGQARAMALARRFADIPLTAAYATAYKRTQQTAAPSAKASGIAVTTYDASRPFSTFVSELRAAHAHGTILIVGHSNTVPAIVAALCACKVSPMGESDYDRLYEVTIDATGRATLAQRTY